MVRTPLRVTATAATLLAVTLGPATTSTASAAGASASAAVTAPASAAAWAPGERCPSSGRLTFRALTVPWWDNVELRAKPSARAKVLTSVPGYWHVRSHARGKTWSKVSFDGHLGWMRTAELSTHRQTYRCTPGSWVSNPQGPAEGA